MSTFDWMQSTPPPAREHVTLSTRKDELAARAGLLARLGYGRQHTEARLLANLAWEYEGLGKAKIEKRLGEIIDEAYVKAGRADALKKRARSKGR